MSGWRIQPLYVLIARVLVFPISCFMDIQWPSSESIYVLTWFLGALNTEGKTRQPACDYFTKNVSIIKSIIFPNKLKIFFLSNKFIYCSVLNTYIVIICVLLLFLFCFVLFCFSLSLKDYVCTGTYIGLKNVCVNCNG